MLRGRSSKGEKALLGTRRNRRDAPEVVAGFLGTAIRVFGRTRSCIRKVAAAGDEIFKHTISCNTFQGNTIRPLSLGVLQSSPSLTN